MLRRLRRSGSFVGADWTNLNAPEPAAILRVWVLLCVSVLRFPWLLAKNSEAIRRILKHYDAFLLSSRKRVTRRSGHVRINCPTNHSRARDWLLHGRVAY